MEKQDIIERLEEVIDDLNKIGSKTYDIDTFIDINEVKDNLNNIIETLEEEE